MSAENPTDSFAAMFEQSAAPSRRRFKVGERVEGRIVQVGRDSVFVELEGGVQGYFDAAELRAPDGTVPVTVGETIAARVTEVDAGRGHVRLARQASIARSLKPSGGTKGGKGGRDAGDGGAAFEQAKDAQTAVEGKVTGVNKGGLEVDVAGTRAFCPLSQAADRFLEDPKELIGQTFHFLVTEVTGGGKNVVLSRRAFLKREAAEGRLGDGGEGEGQVAADPNAPAKAKGNAALKGPSGSEVVIALGSVVKGTVDRIESYGVFLQIEGTRGREGRGLVPAAELGVPRGTDLRKKFPQGHRADGEGARRR